jgi:DNA-binding transcriptional LysR family regulator
MWETVDLRELRAFLALAEELHFGRTADRLRVTPSRVSQSIRALEHKLGVQLVYRTSRQVRLTAAGERFRDAAGAAYDQLMDVLRSTREDSGSLDGVLRLGLFSGPAAGPDLLRIVDAFTGRHPDCRVEVAQVAYPDVLAELRRGEVDLLAAWMPIDDPDLTTGPTLAYETRVLAVARDHPLATRDQVSIEELADWSVSRFVGDLPKALYEAWVPSRTPSGRPIPRDPQAIRLDDITALRLKVTRGDVVHPTVPSAAAYLGSTDVVYVPIADMPPLRSALVWRRRGGDARVLEFVAVARAVLADAQGVVEERATAS